MITLKDAKGNFFDRQKVITATDAATRRVLGRFGAFVRTRARTSIRKRKGTSPPDSPPYSHVGLLRRFILFSYDADRKSVVIGPVLLRAKTAPTVPEVLEYGGTTRAPRYWKSGKNPLGMVTIRARPYMRPALAAELPNLPQMFKDSVKPTK